MKKIFLFSSILLFTCSIFANYYDGFSQLINNNTILIDSVENKIILTIKEFNEQISQIEGYRSGQYSKFCIIDDPGFFQVFKCISDSFYILYMPHPKYEIHCDSNECFNATYLLIKVKNRKILKVRGIPQYPTHTSELNTNGITFVNKNIYVLGRKNFFNGMGYSWAPEIIKLDFDLNILNHNSYGIEYEIKGTLFYRFDVDGNYLKAYTEWNPYGRFKVKVWYVNLQTAELIIKEEIVDPTTSIIHKVKRTPRKDIPKKSYNLLGRQVDKKNFNLKNFKYVVWY